MYIKTKFKLLARKQFKLTVLYAERLPALTPAPTPCPPPLAPTPCPPFFNPTVQSILSKIGLNEKTSWHKKCASLPK